MLGDALARIAKFLGHEVIRDNHIGDWGTQFGMVIYGWKNLLDRAGLDARSDRRACPHLQEANELSDERRRRCAKPAGRNSLGCRPAKKRTCHLATSASIFRMQDFERAYQSLGIHYDIQRGESFYQRSPAGSG